MARKEYENPKAEMTPMIDVVFQLMIFFIVTIKQEDIFSKLAANRPASAKSAAQKEENNTQVTIDINKYAVVFNREKNVAQIERQGAHEGEVTSVATDPKTGKKYRSLEGTALDNDLARIAKRSKDTIVVVNCTADAPHGALVQVLDVCNKHELYNVSVFSL